VFFLNRIYGNRVVLRVQAIISSVLQTPESDECIATFGVVNASLIGSGQLNLKKTIQAYRKAGLSIDEAALSMIDGTVTTLKDLISSKPREECNDIVRLITMLERVLDEVVYFRMAGGRVAPRNGAFSELSKEYGQDMFPSDRSEK